MLEQSDDATELVKRAGESKLRKNIPQVRHDVLTRQSELPPDRLI
jgi:hypothetical protein